MTEKPTPKTMRSRALGRLGFDVSEMALGTWGMSGDASGPVFAANAEQMIGLALELGITLFETADVYGAGEMERMLGRLTDPEASRIVTKIGTFLDEEPPRKRFDPDALGRALDASRERLGRDCIDVVLLHNPAAATLHNDATVNFMRDRVAAKEIGAWGVSAGSSAVARAAISRCVDVLQLPYNIFASQTLHELTDEIAATETALLARSVLAHGLLAGHWSPSKTFFDNDHRRHRWTPEQLRYRLSQLEAVRGLVGGEIITLRAAALRFVLSNHLVSSAVLGPRSPTQLRQLVHEAGTGPEYFDADLFERMPRLLAAGGIELTAGGIGV